MKRNHLYLLISGLFITGLIALYFSTNYDPYKEYQSVWAFRGEKTQPKQVLVIDTANPINLPDTIMMLHQAQDQFKSEVRNELKKARPDFTAVIVSITALLGALVGVIKVIIDLSDKKSSKQHDENIAQHKKIFEMLEIVKDNTVRRSITDNLRKIGSDYMHYQKGIIPDEFRKLIDGQTERLIELTEQIMTETLTEETCDLADIKIDEQSRKAWAQVLELFGPEFLCRYKVAQHHATKSFKEDLQDIAADNIFNHKYERYSRAAQSFLNLLIQTTAKEFLAYNKQVEENEKIHSV